MPSRKDRLPVVLDTNVLIGFHLSANPQSANSRVYRLWRNKRKLQMLVSEETAEEYFAVLQGLGISEESFRRLRRRFDARPTITRVRLGSLPTSSRDPDDNVGQYHLRYRVCQYHLR